MIKKLFAKLFPKKNPPAPEDPYRLRLHPDPVVTTRCIDFDLETEKEEAFALAQEMKKKVLQHRVISLSANQIGVLKRLTVYRADPRQVHPFVCFNPVIVKRGRNVKSGPEGSFSLPMAGGIRGPIAMVPRHTSIEVEYYDEDFHKVRRKLNGWDAKIFQHEIDQLDGLFIRRLIDQKTEIKTATIS